MGAPKKDEKRKHLIGIHLYEHEFDKIKAVALKEERSLAEVVYRMLKTVLYKEKK